MSQATNRPTLPPQPRSREGRVARGISQINAVGHRYEVVHVLSQPLQRPHADIGLDSIAFDIMAG